MSSRLAQPAERDLRRAGRVALRLGQRLGHRRLDEAGGDEVHRDAAAGHFLRQRLGHADQPGLGGGVIGLAGIAGGADDGGDVDDPPGAAAQHAAQRRADQAEGRRQIDIEHLCQSSSFMRSASMSRVSPALLTRMSSGPAPLRPSAISASAAAGSRRSAGQTHALAEFGGQRLQRLPPRAGQRDRRRPAHAARGRSPRRCRPRRR